jgi:hypothetical protein
MLDQRLDAGGELGFQTPRFLRRGESQNVHGEVADIEGIRRLPPPEHLLQEQIEPATGVVEFAVRAQVKGQCTLGCLADLKEERIPIEPPRPRRVGPERQPIAEESERHLAMLAAQGIVEIVVLIRDGREAFDG